MASYMCAFRKGHASRARNVILCFDEIVTILSSRVDGRKYRFRRAMVSGKGCENVIHQQYCRRAPPARVEELASRGPVGSKSSRAGVAAAAGRRKRVAAGRWRSGMACAHAAYEGSSGAEKGT